MLAILVPPRIFRARRRLLWRALLGALLCLAAGKSVQALPRGDARLWVEERYERWGPYGVSRDWQGTLFHLDGRLFPVNTGAWDFLLETSEYAEEFQLTADHLPTALGRASLRLGDYADYGSRSDPLRWEFQPPVWVRGASAGVVHGATAFQLRGGELTRRVAYPALGRRSIGTATYGLDVSGAVGAASYWETSWDRQEPLPDGRPGLHQLRLSVGRRPPRGWSWLGEARYSHDDEGAGDPSFLLGGERASASMTLGGHLRWLGPDFESLGWTPSAYRNQYGARAFAAMRPGRRSLLGGSVDWSRDLSTRADGRAPEQRLTSRAYVHASLAGPLYVSLNGNYRTRSTVDPDSLLVDQGVVSGRGELGWRGAVNGGSVAYTRGLFRDPAGSTGDWHEDRVTGRFHHRVASVLQLDLEASVAERRRPDGYWLSRERRAEGRVTWSPGRAHRVWLTAARDRQEADQALFVRDQWQWGLGWEHPLFWDLAFSIEAIAFVPAGAVEAESGRWNVRLTKNLRFGGGRPGFGEQLPEFGSVSGEVYEDLNGNGVRDAHEPGIPNLVLRLGSGDELVTGPDGRYAFPRAATGMEYVILDEARLPARYLAPDPSRHAVSLAPGQGVTLDFPVRRSAALAGRVVMRTAEGELAGIEGVLLKVRGTHHDVFTDAEGRYTISGLEPGPVSLEVIGWSMPEGATLDGPPVREFTLAQGEARACPDLVFDRAEVPVLQFYRPDDP